MKYLTILIVVEEAISRAVVVILVISIHLITAEHYLYLKLRKSNKCIQMQKM